MAIRIIIADDHRILRAGLRSLLNPDPGLEVVGEATNSKEALSLVNQLRPDVVVLDIGMPGNENLDALKGIKSDSPEIRVLMLTMHEDSELLQECLRLGANGYIIKRAAESELIDAIYAVQRGMVYVHPSMIQSLVAVQKKTKTKSSEVEPLTQREIEVLSDLWLDWY